MKPFFLLSTLFLISCNSCGSGGGADCGQTCTREPANEVESALSTSSTQTDGFYTTSNEVNAQAGDTITVHLNSRDFTTRLQVLLGSTVFAQDSETEAAYIFPGEIPYWEAEVEKTAERAGAYTILVGTAEAGATGEYTLDWTIGEEEAVSCVPVDCGTDI